MTAPEPKLIEVKLNSNPVQIHQQQYTLAELKTELKISQDQLLERVVQKKFFPVEGDHIQVHPGEEFISQGPGGGSS